MTISTRRSARAPAKATASRSRRSADASPSTSSPSPPPSATNPTTTASSPPTVASQHTPALLPTVPESGTVSASSTNSSHSRSAMVGDTTTQLTTATTPASPSAVAATSDDSSSNAARRSGGSNKRLRTATGSVRATTSEDDDETKPQAGTTSTNSSNAQPPPPAGTVSSSSGSDTKRPRVATSVTALPQHEVVARLADLAAKNLHLSSDIELLKRRFTMRQAETTRLLDTSDALATVERDVHALEREYRVCARTNVAMIHDALQHIAYCAAQIDALAIDKSSIGTQLHNFQTECTREMDALIEKLEAVEANQTDQMMRSDLQRDATHDNVERNCDAIAAIQADLQHREAAAAQPVSASNDSTSVLDRIDRFAVQFDAMHAEMAALKALVRHESHASRQSVEALLATQQRDLYAAQQDATTRLQDETDELRSELCDVLKEMHLLKERTRYLRPDALLYRPKRQRYAPATTTTTTTTAAMRQRRNDAFDYAFDSPDDDDDDDDRPSSRSSSPRRPSATALHAIPQQQHTVSDENDQQQHLTTPQQATAQSCPSPHFSSRSSSISGCLSVNRDEMSDQLAKDEQERRLLAQHRLFWIKEGAAEPK